MGEGRAVHPIRPQEAEERSGPGLGIRAADVGFNAARFDQDEVVGGIPVDAARALFVLEKCGHVERGQDLIQRQEGGSHFLGLHHGLAEAQGSRRHPCRQRQPKRFQAVQ